MNPDAKLRVVVYREGGALEQFLRYWLGALGLFLVLVLNLNPSEVPTNDKVVEASILVPLVTLLLWMAWTVGRFQTSVTATEVVVRTSMGRHRAIARSNIADVIPLYRWKRRWFVRLVRYTGPPAPLEGIVRRSDSGLDQAVHDVKELLGIPPRSSAPHDLEAFRQRSVARARDARADRHIRVASVSCTIIGALAIFGFLAFGEHPHQLWLAICG